VNAPPPDPWTGSCGSGGEGLRGLGNIDPRSPRPKSELERLNEARRPRRQLSGSGPDIGPPVLAGMVEQRRVYWVFTGLLAALMAGSASRQVLDHGWAVESFARLGFPAWLIYPLSAAKLLGVAAVVTRGIAVPQEPRLRGVLLPPVARAERPHRRRRRTGHDGWRGGRAGPPGGLVPLQPELVMRFGEQVNSPTARCAPRAAQHHSCWRRRRQFDTHGRPASPAGRRQG